MTLSFSYDIFVSYSHYDRLWVQDRLIATLELRRFNVAVDYRDFKGGAFSVDEMERCVITSKRVIAVYSDDYFASEWSKLENVMSQSLDPGAVQRKLVPVLYKDTTNIPLRLKVINYIDLRKDDAVQWNKLIDSII